MSYDPSASRGFAKANMQDIQKIIGSSWWISVQMLYLMGKFAHESCVFLPISFDPVDEKTYLQQTEISQLVTLTWNCNNRCQFQTPPIMPSSEFFSYLRDCIESSSRLSIIPIKLLKNNISHANMLIYDKLNNTVERFEPHGQLSPEIFGPSDLDSWLDFLAGPVGQILLKRRAAHVRLLT